MKCIRCGNEFMASTLGETLCFSCRTYNGFKYVQFEAPTPQYGWVCPRCGLVNAPYMQACRCRPPIEMTAGTTTTPVEEDS